MLVGPQGKCPASSYVKTELHVIKKEKFKDSKRKRTNRQTKIRKNTTQNTKYWATRTSLNEEWIQMLRKGR